jgi:cobyrinic acid a,c-diamide synthase
LLEGSGAEVVAFDPMSAERLPAGSDALVAGGGFPEIYAADLAGNARLRAEVRQRAAAGMPVLAECGGLLWLGSDLEGHEQCGVLPARARMTGRLTLGYREAAALTCSPLAAAGTVVRGHEFHRTVSEPAAGPTPAWRLGDGTILGWASRQLLASYLHVHWAGIPGAASRLVAAALAARAGPGSQTAPGALAASPGTRGPMAATARVGPARRTGPPAAGRAGPPAGRAGQAAGKGGG